MTRRRGPERRPYAGRTRAGTDRADRLDRLDRADLLEPLARLDRFGFGRRAVGSSVRRADLEVPA
ncbi:hypothetical protein [Streptomyces sp. NPDC007088]|uniref:hypothetical protein n=1 Tax=Streptomyces sp. NPDC007088 TaxID=3364773 RepID=UPI0036B90255